MKSSNFLSRLRRKIHLNLRGQFFLAILFSTILAFIAFKQGIVTLEVFGNLDAMPVIQFNTFLILIFFGASVTFIFSFYLVTRKLFRDIQKIAEGLQEISKGNFSILLNVESQNEIGKLATNVNRMATELERIKEEDRKREEYKNNLVTNVSHDLRTPLIIRNFKMRVSPLKKQKYY